MPRNLVVVGKRRVILGLDVAELGCGWETARRARARYCRNRLWSRNGAHVRSAPPNSAVVENENEAHVRSAPPTPIRRQRPMRVMGQVRWFRPRSLASPPGAEAGGQKQLQMVRIHSVFEPKKLGVGSEQPTRCEQCSRSGVRIAIERGTPMASLSYRRITRRMGHSNQNCQRVRQKATNPGGIGQRVCRNGRGQVQPRKRIADMGTPLRRTRSNPKIGAGETVGTSVATAHGFFIPERAPGSGTVACWETWGRPRGSMPRNAGCGWETCQRRRHGPGH